MNEAKLHSLSVTLGGRFKLTALVQKRLIELMANHDPIIVENSGGRPIRLVVDEVGKGRLQLAAPDGTELTPPIDDAEPAKPAKTAKAAKAAKVAE